MLVPRLQMPVTDLVLIQVELVQLRHRRLQSLADPAKVSRALPYRGPGHPQQKIGAVRIVASVSPAVRLPDQMRHQVEIADRAQEIDYRPELAVGIDLLQMGLRHPLRVRFVVRVRPFENHLAISRDDLALEDRAMAAARFGGECHVVRPRGGSAVVADSDLQGDVSVVEVPGGETADARYAAPVGHRVLKAAAGGRDLPQEPQGIQEIRFA